MAELNAQASTEEVVEQPTTVRPLHHLRAVEPRPRLEAHGDYLFGVLMVPRFVPVAVR